MERKYIMIKCDWLKFFSKLSGIQNGNSRMLRHIKSHAVSKMLEKYSNLTYVDEIGYDFVMDDGTKVELKTQAELFLKTKTHTNPIALKNTQGKKVNLNKTFDILLLIQTEKPFRVAYIGWDKVEPHVEFNGDQYIVRLKYHNLKFINTDFFDWDLKTEKWDLKDEVFGLIEAKI